MSKETLALMLAGERQDTPWVETTLRNAQMPDHAKFDCFDECVTVVEAVELQMELDEACNHEIDAVEQYHYLRGPNAYTEEELRMMGWEARTEAANR